jgi:hypothetical protein
VVEEAGENHRPWASNTVSPYYFFIFFSEWCMETSGSITDFNNIEKPELNEKLRHFYAEAKSKNIEKRAKSMLDEHAQVYHKNTCRLSMR